MSAGDGVECFDLRMTLENQAAECADRGRAVEAPAASSCGDAANEPGLNRLRELAD
jgi:hypothetical protein